jgi:hypothetical protein
MRSYVVAMAVERHTSFRRDVHDYEGRLIVLTGRNLDIMVQT